MEVWCSSAPSVQEDPEQLFAKCVINSAEKKKAKLTQVDPKVDFEAPLKECYQINPGLNPITLNDIGMMGHTNVACVNDFLRNRFLAKEIYSTADPLLVVLNPFKDLKNTTDEVIKKYRDVADVETLSPHVFGIARRALENIHSVKKSQTLIVSGESGAGKTEATKQIMRYFAAGKAGSMDLRIQNAVLAANPVLEAFGNAKTVKNNNSSRFGRFMQLSVLSEGGISGGCLKNFLLEKSRIVMQEPNERSYHVFYQILSGADSAMKKKFCFQDVSKYRMINQMCTTVDSIDDVSDYKELEEALTHIGLDETKKDSIWSIVSAILLLGNVEVTQCERDGVPDASFISDEGKKDLLVVCKLLGLNPDLLADSFVNKITYAGKEQIKGVWKAPEALMLKESLAKAIYEKTFQWLVEEQLNPLIMPAEGFKEFMGMLDIFGFEMFEKNSLEQLFINITNEMLQKNFVNVVFERETKLYRKEGVCAANFVWTSNVELIQDLTAKKGLMSILEDQCLAPSASDEKFVGSAFAGLKDSQILKKTKFDSHISFIVVHTIGEITYNATGFILKNKDVLRPEFVDLVNASTDPVVGALFAGIKVEKGKIGRGELIGSQFLLSLGSLMDLINSTEPHFVRCVKTNEHKMPLHYVPEKVVSQLYSLSILEALQLRQLGYSYRRPFEEFLSQFKYVDLGITQDTSIHPKEAAKLLLEGCKIPNEEWQIGKTMTFMSSVATKKLTTIQREKLSAWVPVVQILEACIIKQVRRQNVVDLQPALVRLQAQLRRVLHAKA
eukprot:GHVP01045222.1.p1 GENE.GHVP01045222.1~~GHVP01045222.1.p1  ORF type:complete len:809 (+),score=141.40 GHVP01045222.1:80-2428(+)